MKEKLVKVAEEKPKRQNSRMSENKEKLEKEVKASEKSLDKDHSAMNVERNAN